MPEFIHNNVKDIPQRLNWFERGFAGPVRNQGQFGTCYAHVTATTLESALRIYTNNTIPQLSAQELVNYEIYSDEWHGGSRFTWFDYIAEMGGLVYEKDYPYYGKHIATPVSMLPRIGDIITYNQVPQSRAAFLKALSRQPLSCHIIMTEDIATYEEDIYLTKFNPSRAQGFHAILVVGFIFDNNHVHYVLQNSWGDTRRRGGFIYIREDIAREYGLYDIVLILILKEQMKGGAGQIRYGTNGRSHGTISSGRASQGEEPETLSSMLAAASPEKQKVMLGEHLLPLIKKDKFELAYKVIGMLLKMDNSELLLLLESPEALVAKVEDAEQVLYLSHARVEPSGGVDGIKDNAFLSSSSFPAEIAAN